jgi:hypothetical protein
MELINWNSSIYHSVIWGVSKWSILCFNHLVNLLDHVRFQTHVEVSMRGNVVWDMTPCIVSNRYQPFGETPASIFGTDAYSVGLFETSVRTRLHGVKLQCVKPITEQTGPWLFVRVCFEWRSAHRHLRLCWFPHCMCHNTSRMKPQRPWINHFASIIHQLFYHSTERSIRFLQIRKINR